MRANGIPNISVEWHNNSSFCVSQSTRDESQRKTPRQDNNYQHRGCLLLSMSAFKK